jgi:hypothetical protein
MRSQFRPGEIVRIVGAPGLTTAPRQEAVVEEVAGPNDEGSGWLLTLRLCDETGGDTMVVLDEEDLEATGYGESGAGERVVLEAGGEDEPEPRDCLELRLFTEIADGIEAARVAHTIEQELAALLGGATVSTEAERHWSEPFNYELAVSVVPDADPVEALQILAEAGGEGWLACRDDGWRCELWWSATRDPDAMLIVPEVHAAEIAYLPWSTPSRRREADRPLVSVDVPQETPDEPPAAQAADDETVEEPPEEPSNPETGDEEA